MMINWLSEIFYLFLYLLLSLPLSLCRYLFIFFHPYLYLLIILSHVHRLELACRKLHAKKRIVRMHAKYINHTIRKREGERGRWREGEKEGREHSYVHVLMCMRHYYTCTYNYACICCNYKVSLKYGNLCISSKLVTVSIPSCINKSVCVCLYTRLFWSMCLIDWGYQELQPSREFVKS